MKKITLLLTIIMISSAFINAETIAYWRFEQGTNGTKHTGEQDNWYLDCSGNSNYLSAEEIIDNPYSTNDVPFNAVPLTGETNLLALSCDGSMSISTCGSYGDPIPINTYGFTNAFTVECMVKYFDFNYAVVVGNDGRPTAFGDPLFALKHRNQEGKPIQLAFFDGAGNNHKLYSSSYIDTGIWYRVAAVCDSSNAYLYIKHPGLEYQLEATETNVINGLYMMDSFWTVGRGMWGGNPQDYLKGCVDEVRISDTALTVTQFLGYSSQPELPVFQNIEYNPMSTPTEINEVTVQTTVANATNVTLQYRVDGGAWNGPYEMTTNTISDEFYFNISTQAVDSVVEFKMEAFNSGFQSTVSEITQYKVYEDLQWHSVLVTTNASVALPFFSSMALAPDGNAGIVYYQDGTGAMYVSESSLGVFAVAENISGDQIGSFNDLVYGGDGNPHIVLGKDYSTGIVFAQKISNVWTTPLTLPITAGGVGKRAVITMADGKPSVLWFGDGVNSYGVLDNGNAAGDSFVESDIYMPSPATLPSVRPFEMITGSDGLRRIVVCAASENIFLATETSVGSSSFSLEEVTTGSYAYADQVGFVLDSNNKAYITAHASIDGKGYAILFDNMSGSWEETLLTEMILDDPNSASAVTIDNWGNVWVTHNSPNNYIYLYSNRSGSWKREDLNIADIHVENYCGLAFDENDVMKLAFRSDDSPNIEYMYSTKFGVPEPSLFLLIICQFLFIKYCRKSRL